MGVILNGEFLKILLGDYGTAMRDAFKIIFHSSLPKGQ